MTDAILIALGMKALGDLAFFNAVDARAPGWSFVLPITTSHISGHYFDDEKPNIRVDIYSCNKINIRVFIKILDQYLALTDWKGTFIKRFILKNRESIEISGFGKEISRSVKLLHTHKIKNSGKIQV